MVDDDFVYDPYAVDFQDRMFEIYRIMRDDYPVYRHPNGRFALSRYADVLCAMRETSAFSSDVEEARGLLPMMVFLDPPRHTALRALVSRAFTPKRIAEREVRVRQIADELLSSLATEGADLLHDFAAVLPSMVVGEMIGVPTNMLEQFRIWSGAFMTNTEGTEEASLNIYELFTGLLADRRKQPQDDLMTALISAEVDGQQLSEPELLGFCFLLLLGGNDTTTSLIANGVELLATHPDQCAELINDPARIPLAIEEMLRFASPTQALPRKTLCDVEMHGTTIPQGSQVMLVFGAANLDERAFSEPERFDIHRSRSHHLALGHGIHSCLGASLARQEARVAFEELLRRYPRYELLERPRRLRSDWARTFESLPVLLRPSKAPSVMV